MITQPVDIPVPQPIPLEVPKFQSLTAPSPPPPAIAPVTSFVWQAYGTAIHDYLDGQVSDLSQYYYNLSTVFRELRTLYVTVGRKYDKARRDYLSQVGGRNPQGMPGHVMRKLSDISIEERRELSEEALKLISEKIAISRDSVKVASEQALLSDAIRFDSHHRIQSANFEVASAIVDAAIKTCIQNVERYNDSLALVALQWEEVKQHLKWQEQQVQQFSMEIEAATVVILNEALLQELRTIPYLLQAIEAKKAALLYEMDLLKLEIEKNHALLEIAYAEQLVANAKEITASYEIEKSGVRTRLANNEYAKTDLDIERTEAGTRKAQAQADIDRAELALSVAEKELGLLEDRFRVLTHQANAALTRAKEAIPEAQRQANLLRVTTINSVSQRDTQARLDEATGRVEIEGERQQDIKDLSMKETAARETEGEQRFGIAMERVGNIGEASAEETTARLEAAIEKVEAFITRANAFWNATVIPDRAMTAVAKTSIITATDSKYDNLIAAANSAANADVSSDFYYYRAKAGG